MSDNDFESEELNEQFFPKTYDLTEVFMNQIKPMMTTIINLCDEYDLPMIAAFQFKGEGNAAEFATSAVLPPDRADVTLHEAHKMLVEGN